MSHSPARHACAIAAFVLVAGIPAAMAASDDSGEATVREHASCRAAGKWAGCVRRKPLLTMPGVGHFEGRCEADPLTGTSRAVIHLAPVQGAAILGSSKARRVTAADPPVSGSAEWVVRTNDGTRNVRIVSEASVLRGTLDDVRANPRCSFHVKVHDIGTTGGGSRLSR